VRQDWATIYKVPGMVKIPGTFVFSLGGDAQI
jgi:hypothetical protein